MSFIGYARVSTKDQTLDGQVDALRSLPCDRIFKETASGASRDRPQLMAALDYMRPGDTLAVWKLDRLARSLRQLIETFELLDSRNIGFRSLTEAIDTRSPGGKLIFQIFGALAEFERSLIRERTRAGLDAARIRGRRGGRPKKMTDEDLKIAKALLADPDINVADIAGRLGVSMSTFYRYLPAARSAGDDK